MQRAISGTTTVVGVFGHPVAHSFSPSMHNAAFAHLGLDWVYVPFPVPPETLPAAVAGIRALGLAGVNVTIPHKQAVIPCMDLLTPDARAVGSVNTITVCPAGLEGHSTDGPGFLRALLERGYTPAGRRGVILGAGGAARAVVGALARAGTAHLTLVARNPAHAAALATLATTVAADAVQVDGLPWGADAVRTALATADLVVNATPLGMAPHAVDRLPVPADWLAPGCWVYDLVYTPRETALLRAARARGCQVIDGLAMLLYQGAEAFTRWTGQPAPLAVMEAVLSAQGNPR